MFSNEASLPYLTKVEPITYVTMARIIGEILAEIKVPHGVNVLWDPLATIDLAVATGSLFVREIFSGVYASEGHTNPPEPTRRGQIVNSTKPGRTQAVSGRFSPGAAGSCAPAPAR